MDLDKYLEIYSFEEILEINDLTEEEVLTYLVENNIITLPEICSL